MPWGKVDDHFHAHRKTGEALASEPLSLSLWVLGLSYACQQMDGFVPRWFAEQKLPKRTSRERAIRALVSAGLWEEDSDGGWQIHNFLRWNPREKYDGKLRRKRLYANAKLIAEVRERDGDYCRYCGEPVIANDHRSPRGRTIDQLAGDGPDALENLVVCCRGCQSEKAGRTPEEAGMMVLPAPAKQLRLAGQNGTKTQPADRVRTGFGSGSDRSPVPGPVPGPVPVGVVQT